MIGAISGVGSRLVMYHSSAIRKSTSAQAAQGMEPAAGIRPPSALNSGSRMGNSIYGAAEGAYSPPIGSAASDEGKDPALFLRQGVDPVEYAVRMRIRYMEPEALGEPDPAKPTTEAGGVGKTDPSQECQTCKQRKYQDGSDDMGVSFKTPTRIAPEAAGAMVRSHERQHVSRERAKAEREDRQVVSQVVTLRTGICPECGTVYIAGGSTRTVTISKPEPAERVTPEEA